MKKQITIGAALLLAGILANAQGYIDTRQNLYFMSLLPTLGMSENQAVATFTDFRPATEVEVGQLWMDCGIPQVSGLFQGISTTNTAAMASLDKVMNALGSTTQQDGHLEMLGLTAPHTVAGFDFVWDCGLPSYVITPNSYVEIQANPDYAFPEIGTFMVQTIPEPNTISIISMAVTGLVFARISRRNCAGSRSCRPG